MATETRISRICRPLLAVGGLLLAVAAQAALLEDISYRQTAVGPQAQLSPGSIRRQIPRVAVPPGLDGQLQDDCWRLPEAYLGTFRLGLSANSARHTREAWACYDNRNLYVAVRLQREPHQPLRVFTKTDDDGKIWEDDEIEMFFDPFGTGSEYYQIIINSGGHLFDATHKIVTVLDPAGAAPTDTKRENLMDTAWSAGLQRVIAVAEGDWVAEMALPLASIGLDEAPAGHGLRFNVTSADWDTKEYTCLSPTSDWHDPLQFGTLVLGTPMLEVQALDLGLMGMGRNRLSLTVRDLTGQAGKRLANLVFDGDAAQARLQQAIDLPARGAVTVDLPFTVAAREGDWTARVSISDAEGQALFAARRAGVIPPPLLVRLGSQGVFTGSAPVPVAVSCSLGYLSLRAATLAASLTDAEGRTVARQELGTPETALLSALMPVDDLKPGTYTLVVMAYEGTTEVARSAARLRVSPSPYEH